MRKFFILITSVVLAARVVVAIGAEIVFVAGDTRLAIDEKGKLYCSYCGYGEEFVPIDGQAPGFLGTAPQAFFSDRFLIITKTDMGISCPAGSWHVIDLKSRVSKEIRLPNCDEVRGSYAEKDGKVFVSFVQGKKLTKFEY